MEKIGDKRYWCLYSSFVLYLLYLFVYSMLTQIGSQSVYASLYISAIST